MPLTLYPVDQHGSDDQSEDGRQEDGCQGKKVVLTPQQVIEKRLGSSSFMWYFDISLSSYNAFLYSVGRPMQSLQSFESVVQSVSSTSAMLNDACNDFQDEFWGHFKGSYFVSGLLDYYRGQVVTVGVELTLESFALCGFVSFQNEFAENILKELLGNAATIQACGDAKLCMKVGAVDSSNVGDLATGGFIPDSCPVLWSYISKYQHAHKGQLPSDISHETKIKYRTRINSNRVAIYQEIAISKCTSHVRGIWVSGAAGRGKSFYTNCL